MKNNNGEANPCSQTGLNKNNIFVFYGANYMKCQAYGFNEYDFLKP